MRIGMTSLTLRNECVESVLKYAKAAGIEGIEWGVSDLHMPLCDKAQAEKIKALSKESGIEIFSLGSYCRVTDREECEKTVETAAMLGAPVIRVWAGAQSPCDGDEEYRNMIAENTRYMAEKAASYGIKLGFEYHGGTLTETPESAVDFIKRVNADNVGLYWQPVGALSVEENLRAFKAVLPYAVGNLHVHNHTVETGYRPLAEMEEKLHTYYDGLKDKDYNLMIEFVMDASPENVKADAEILRKVIR